MNESTSICPTCKHHTNIFGGEVQCMFSDCNTKYITSCPHYLEEKNDECKRETEAVSD